MEGLRGALAELLRKKMKATVRRGTGTIQAEDAIDEEVGKFMASKTPIQVEDLMSLENRIHAKLDAIGVAKRPKMLVNEWAVLFKYQMEQGEQMEREKQARLAQKREAMSRDLAKQVKVVERRKEAEKEEQKKFAIHQAEDLRKWKAEEEAKVEKKREAIERLKIDRAVQLAEKADRLKVAERQKKMEEEEERRQVLIEHKALIQKEEAEAARKRDAAARFLHDNEEQQRIKAEIKRKEGEDSVRMQQMYAERLKHQEEAYMANLEKMKARQMRQEAAGNAVGPYKRYLDDSIIEKNFQKREAELEEREKRDKAKIHTLRTALKADLEKQLAERVVLKRLAKEEDMSMVMRVNEGAKVAEIIEREKQEKIKAKNERARIVLEEQIKANVAARQVVTMSDVEKQLNIGTLERITESKITLPARGLLAYRQIPGHAPQTLREMRKQ